MTQQNLPIFPWSDLWLFAKTDLSRDFLRSSTARQPINPRAHFKDINVMHSSLEGQSTEACFMVMPPPRCCGESIKAVRFQSPAALSGLGDYASHPAVYGTSQYDIIGVSIQNCGLRTVDWEIGFLKPNNAPYVDSCKDRILS